jgi:hypothetical protein
MIELLDSTLLYPPGTDSVPGAFVPQHPWFAAVARGDGPWMMPRLGRPAPRPLRDTSRETDYLARGDAAMATTRRGVGLADKVLGRRDGSRCTE